MSRCLPILLLPLLATGCQTTVGNYFANRGRDLSECFLVQVGYGPGLGAEVKAAGLAHIGGIYITQDTRYSVGWAYGQPRPNGGKAELDHRLREKCLEGDLGLIVGLHSGFCQRGGKHMCTTLIPGLLSAQSHTESAESKPEYIWLWATGGAEDPRVVWSRVHVFDVEVGITVLFLGARAGFSPGEFLDFLLGWVGIDIAGDDREWVTEEEDTSLPVPEPRQATEGERLK